jgi:hypothetical protein
MGRNRRTQRNQFYRWQYSYCSDQTGRGQDNDDFGLCFLQSESASRLLKSVGSLRTRPCRTWDIGMRSVSERARIYCKDGDHRSAARTGHGRTAVCGCCS